ncbi:MAG: hypothetical protein ACREVG_03645, partial [Burkholderiales bacterium]
MHLILALPGLLTLDETATAPHLARIIAAARAPLHEPGGMGAALARAFGVERQRDWPLAPIRLASHGVDPGAHYWLSA